MIIWHIEDALELNVKQEDNIKVITLYVSCIRNVIAMSWEFDFWSVGIETSTYIR